MVINENIVFTKAGRAEGIFYTTIIFLSTVLTFSTAGLTDAYNHGEVSMFKNFIAVLIILSYIAIGGIAVIYLSVTSTDRQMKEMLQQQQMMNMMQEQYYETLLEKEAETRAYRHDMSNHLLTLKHLAGSGDVSSVNNYIDTMQNKITQGSDHIIQTGNELIDMLSAHYRKLLPSPEIMVVKGFLHDEIPIDHFHLTTIYANLLQNAVEAVLNDPKPEDKKKILISVNNGHAAFRLIVENTYDDTRKTVYVQKGDGSGKHGYGLSNVRRATEETGGIFEAERSNGVYTATFTMVRK